MNPTRSRRLLSRVAMLFAAVALAGPAVADVKLPAIISDNLCLQAAKPLTIWGWANPDEKVTVKLGDETQSATADAKGNWSVKFKPVAAGQTPSLTVEGANKIEVKNVIVGDVWVASGQSNMEFGFSGAHNAATEAPKAKYPKIRIFNLQKKIAFEPQKDCVGKWVECSPETVMGTSAVGYFFSRDIHEALNIPVGLIHTSWGGTPAQAWTSMEGLAADPEMKQFIDQYEQISAGPEKLKQKYAADVAKWEEAHKKWQAEYGAPYAKALKDWQKEEATAKAAGKTGTPKPQPGKPDPRRPNDPTNNPNIPSVLYNGMIAPIINYAIQGAIWYQGESNAGQPLVYRKLFPDMISDWRKHWAEGDFSFYWVQLANFMAREKDPVQSDGGWPGLREAQHMTLALPNTGEAVIIDVGQAEDIHPKDKMDVGHRLALAALHTTYGKELVYSGPTYDEMKVDGNKVKVKFKNAGGGLVIAAAPATQPSVPQASPKDHLVGFAIAGEDHKFVWANAKIESNDAVTVWSDEVKNPVAVRYGWGNNPEANLYNKEQLPASPFRTDNWGAVVPANPAKK